MFFRLDDRPAVEVNLTSPTGSDTPTHVVWSAVGLPNSPHSLELLPGQLGFVDVDAIMYDSPFLTVSGKFSEQIIHRYTRLAESNTNTTSPTPSASPQPAESSSSTLALGLGIALGVLAAIVVAFGAFYLGRRSRARRSKASSASTSPGTATAAADMQPGDPDYYQPTTELITPYPKRQPTMTSMNQYGMPPTTYPHRQATMRSTNPNPMSPTSVYDEESAISGDHEGSSSHHPTVLTFYPMHPSNHYSSKHPLPEDVDPDHEKKRGNAISPPPMYSVQNN